MLPTPQAGPYRLDDASVDHVIRTFSVTRDDLDHLFAEQGRRWRAATTGSHQHRGDVEHYCALVAEERALVEEILILAEQLKAMTIDRLLAKSDLEVGIESVLGHTLNWTPVPDDRRMRCEPSE